MSNTRRRLGQSGSRRKRPGLWLLGLGLPVLVAGGWWSVGRVTAPDVQWIAVENDDLVLSVEVEGTLEAVETTVITPPQIREVWQYKIAFMAPEGEPIEQGQRVLAFDATELQQRLQQELAERDADRKRVEKAEREYTVRRKQDELALAEARAELRKARLKTEQPVQFTASRELEQLRLDHELAEKRVAYREAALDASLRSAEANLGALRTQAEQAEQTVQQTESSIRQMERTAPIAGTVIYTTNWRDEKKQVGDTCWRGEDVIELPNLDHMKAMGKVHEAEAGRVAEGQRVTLRLDAHPDVEFVARVAKIWRTVQKESWRSPLKVVRLDIELEQTDSQRMKPGMRFRGRIETERIDAALVVDADAVFLEDAGPVVYRKTWRGFEPVRVELGRRNQRRVEVLDGLQAGDRVSAVDLAQRRSPA